MAWWYELRGAENRLVAMRRGFATEKDAQEAARPCSADDTIACLSEADGGLDHRNGSRPTTQGKIEGCQLIRLLV